MKSSIEAGGGDRIWGSAFSGHYCHEMPDLIMMFVDTGLLWLFSRTVPPPLNVAVDLQVLVHYFIWLPPKSPTSRLRITSHTL